jgi:hypothetical protein
MISSSPCNNSHTNKIEELVTNCALQQGQKSADSNKTTRTEKLTPTKIAERESQNRLAYNRIDMRTLGFRGTGSKSESFSGACERERWRRALLASRKRRARQTAQDPRSGRGPLCSRCELKTAMSTTNQAQHSAHWTWLGDNETSGPRCPSTRPRQTLESRNKHTSGKSTKISRKARPDRSSPHMSGLDRIRPAAEHRAVLIKGLTLEPESRRAHKPEAKTFSRKIKAGGQATGKMSEHQEPSETRR